MATSSSPSSAAVPPLPRLPRNAPERARPPKGDNPGANPLRGTMSEILPGIHQVEGVDPSPEFSTHVYLVKDRGSGWTLIDTGLPGADAAILAYLGKIGASPNQVKNILITHLHNDHT